MTYIAVGPVLSHIRVGKLKALAVTEPVRASFLPDVPTLAEFKNSPGMNTWVSLFAPSKSPPPVVGRLNAEYANAQRIYKTLGVKPVEVPSS